MRILKASYFPLEICNCFKWDSEGTTLENKISVLFFPSPNHLSYYSSIHFSLDIMFLCSSYKVNTHPKAFYTALSDTGLSHALTLVKFLFKYYLFREDFPKSTYLKQAIPTPHYSLLAYFSLPLFVLLITTCCYIDIY